MAYTTLEPHPLFQKHNDFRELFIKNRMLIEEHNIDYNYYYQTLFSYSTAPAVTYYEDLTQIVVHMKDFLKAYGNAVIRKQREQRESKTTQTYSARTKTNKMMKISNELYHKFFKLQVELTRMLSINTDLIKKISDVFLTTIQEMNQSVQVIKFTDGKDLAEINRTTRAIREKVASISLIHSELFKHEKTIKHEEFLINKFFNETKELVELYVDYFEEKSQVNEMISEIEIYSLLNSKV